MKLFEAVGRRACEYAASMRENLAFLGETTVCALSILVRPRRFRFGDSALAFERASFDALPVTTGIGFLLGLILAFQSAAALKMFGVEVYVSDLLAIALFRELGPLVTAIVLAGRTGSAFAAEIGAMKVDEELDALTTMGLPPVRFLVMPRVVAAVAAMPILTIFAELTCRLPSSGATSPTSRPCSRFRSGSPRALSSERSSPSWAARPECELSRRQTASGARRHRPSSAESCRSRSPTGFLHTSATSGTYDYSHKEQKIQKRGVWGEPQRLTSLQLCASASLR